MAHDLRDYFAAQLAAVLARDRVDSRQIAADAYDLAEALVDERVRRDRLRRAWSDEAPVIDTDLEAWLVAQETKVGLLDEPTPLSEAVEDDWDSEDDGAARADDEPIPASWADRELAPRWEQEERWGPSDPSADGSRPGLASTRPEAQPQKKERHG